MEFGKLNNIYKIIETNMANDINCELFSRELDRAYNCITKL